MHAALLRWEEHPTTVQSADGGWRAVYDLSKDHSNNYVVYASHVWSYSGSGWHLVELQEL